MCGAKICFATRCARGCYVFPSDGRLLAAAVNKQHRSEPVGMRERAQLAQQHVSTWDMHMYIQYVQLEMCAQHTLRRKISGTRYARGISGACVNRVGISGWGCERIGRNLYYSTDL